MRLQNKQKNEKTHAFQRGYLAPPRGIEPLILP